MDEGYTGPQHDQARTRFSPLNPGAVVAPILGGSALIHMPGNSERKPP